MVGKESQFIWEVWLEKLCSYDEYQAGEDNMVSVSDISYLTNPYRFIFKSYKQSSHMKKVKDSLRHGSLSYLTIVPRQWCRVMEISLNFSFRYILVFLGIAGISEDRVACFPSQVSAVLEFYYDFFCVHRLVSSGRN